MRLYLRCLKYLKPYIWVVLLSVICMIFYSAFNAAPLAVLKVIIDKVLLMKGENTVTIDIPVINKSFQSEPIVLLKLASVLIIVLSVLKGIFDYGQSYLTNYAGSKAIIDLRNKFFEQIHSQPLAFFTSEKTGKIVSRITNDVGLIKDSLTVIFRDIIQEPITIAVILMVMFNFNKQLTVLALMVFPFTFFLLTKFGKKIRRISYNRQKRQAEVLGVIQESMQGAGVIKAFGTESYELSRFDKAQNHAFRLDMKRARILALSSPTMELIGILGISLILFIGGKQVITGKLTIGQFSAFMVALASLYGPVKKLVQVNNEIQTALAGAQRVFELMDAPLEIKDLPEAEDLPPFNKEVRFNNVSFSYNHKPILKNINLKIKKGEVVAIVGISGVGKTTLLNLLPRFYDPVEGTIEIDGHDIKNVRIISLRKQIAIVSQETFLFNDTVRANITYGYNGQAAEERIIEIAKSASAHEFIEKLTNGYDTIVGERGTQLSGGQRQRIAIARALLKDPSILILDEATSELDSEAENVVQEALEKLMKGRTTFIIAHRLSTILHADKIAVLDKGTVIEVGVHEELIIKDGIYKRLYEMQYNKPRKN